MIKTALQPLQSRWITFLHNQEEVRTGSGNPQQQTQQQQVVDDFVDPYKDVDLDLMDDVTRKTLEATRDSMRKLHNDAKQSKEWQSRYDKLVAHQQQQLQQQQQQVKPQDKPAVPTFEDELYDTYIAKGFAPADAKRMVEINSPIFGRFADRTQKFVESRLAPLQSTIEMQKAEASFMEVESTGIFGSPEIKEAVWVQTQNMIEAGGEVNEQVIENLAIIANHKAGTQVTPQQRQVQPMHQQQQSIAGGTRFTYPGAGRSVQTVQPRIVTPALDPDTAAAIAATKAHMRGFMKPDNKPVRHQITRGGK